MDKDFVVGSVMNLWVPFIEVVPQFLIGILILVVGLIASSVLSHVVRRVIQTLKIDDAVQRFSAFRKAQDAGWKITPSHLLSNIVKWLIIIMTLMALADHFSLSTISDFLQDIMNYIPHVVVAIVLLAVGFVVGQFAHDIAKQSLKSSNMGEQAVKVAPLVAKYAIIVFAGMTAATQLGIVPGLIETFFTAVMAAFALALGLAFGLGGKEHASRVLDKLHK